MEAQQLHRGRLLDHVQLIAKDLAATRTFYEAVLAALGRRIEGEGDGYFWSDELFVSDRKMQTSGPTHVHLAFQAASREQVERFHAAAIRAGGRDNGKPGERAEYHPGYYASFAIDPDGNNVEAVYHGEPKRRSADSVVIDFDA